MKIIVSFKWKRESLVIHGKFCYIERCTCYSSSFVSAEKDENAKFAEEEEQLRKNFTEKVKSEEGRFRQWEQQVSFY
jgi:septin family protein